MTSTPRSRLCAKQNSFPFNNFGQMKRVTKQQNITAKYTHLPLVITRFTVSESCPGEKDTKELLKSFIQLSENALWRALCHVRPVKCPVL